MNEQLTFIVISSTNDVSVEKTIESIYGLGRILLIDGGKRKHYSNITPGEISLENLAKKYNCDYLYREYDYAASQYNFGISNVATEWVYVIDSDETISTELSEWINRGNFESKTFFKVKRYNHFLGKNLSHGQFKPDWNIRLFKPAY